MNMNALKIIFDECFGKFFSDYFGQIIFVLFDMIKSDFETG